MTHAIAIMKEMGREPEFVLAVGDDNSDEPMFEALNTVRNTGIVTWAILIILTILAGSRVKFMD